VFYGVLANAGAIPCSVRQNYEKFKVAFCSLFNDAPLFWNYTVSAMDGWGALVEWYWQVNTRNIHRKLVPAPICSPQIPQVKNKQFNTSLNTTIFHFSSRL